MNLLRKLIYTSYDADTTALVSLYRTTIQSRVGRIFKKKESDYRSGSYSLWIFGLQKGFDHGSEMVVRDQRILFSDLSTLLKIGLKIKSAHYWLMW